MRRRGTPFQGLLYAGLAVTSRGIRVVEFNARFGDPETQVLLARLRTPLGSLLYAAATGRLAETAPLTWRDGAAVAVVVAAHGYPQAPRKGDLIEGLDAAAGIEGVQVIHAGTALDSHGRLVTAGGRVLAVTALGADLDEARSRAYSGVAAIRIDGAHYRSDIALQPIADSILSS
jgi:phosphoribosylamine--glycine ligase